MNKKSSNKKSIIKGLSIIPNVEVVHIRNGKVIGKAEVHNLTTADGDFSIGEYLHNSTVGFGATWSNNATYSVYTAGSTAGYYNWIGVSTGSITPAAADTTMAQELGTLGLSRAQGTFSKLAGVGNVQVQKTFTATGTVTGAQASALFSSGSNGVGCTMLFEATFSSVNLINNDQLQVTWNITYA